jgi:hypothetical protein
MSKQKLSIVPLLALLAIVLALGFSQAARGQQIAGNASCKQLLNNNSAYEIKVETPGINNDASYGPITFTDVNAGKTLMGFTSPVPVKAVFVKGGPDGGHFYSADSYPTTYPAMSDTNMGTNGYGDGRYQISHVSFCWDEPPVIPQALTATKTAAGNYNRTITWDLTKNVEPASHNGNAGEIAGIATWEVVATKSENLSGFSVSGDIVVFNPNDFAVNFSVTDTFDDGTVATVTCPTGGAFTGTVPANGSITCSYTASPVDATATTNNAVVTSLTEGVPGATALATIDWTETLFGYELGMLSDPRFGYSEEISATTTETFEESFECPDDASLYVDGVYQFIETNIATLNEQIGLEAIATVNVDCTLPALFVEKMAAGSYDRTIAWTLEKSVDPASHSGQAGEEAGSSIWSVVATKSVVEDNYLVTGTIHIHNLAAIPQTFTVSDVLDDDTVATVTCPAGYTLAAGAATTCTYSAVVAGAELNTATVSAPGNADVLATAPVVYTANVIGYESGTLSDPRFRYSEEISATTTGTFEEIFECPADASLYVNGFYQFTETNIATLNEQIGLQAIATVNVDCTYPWAGETATGAGNVYPGSSNWFMYTAYTTSKVDLIAGQHYDAGDIFMSKSGSVTTITIVLHEGWRWADVLENLKIQPFNSAPSAYVSPGAFLHKFTVSGNTITVLIPDSGKAKFYGIHGDVERLVTAASPPIDEQQMIFLPLLASNQ